MVKTTEQRHQKIQSKNSLEDATKRFPPKNFGYDVSVRPSVHSLGRVRGRESDVGPSKGGVCHIFLAGNRAMHLCNPHFSWREIAQEMAWPLSLRSKTCLLWELVFS